MKNMISISAKGDGEDVVFEVDINCSTAFISDVLSVVIKQLDCEAAEDIAIDILKKVQKT